MRIGDDTSIQDGTVILGEVSLGRHCLLSSNIFISSGNHYCDLHPSWLIRDQDALANSQASADSRVVIEDDVWIGWGAFVKRGTYIGRGAVLGAYAVVTHDVPPYSIQAGVPSREVRKRFDFQPTSRIEAANSDHLPYFYSGFDLRQASLRDGVAWANSNSSVMVSRKAWQELSLTGELAPGIDSIRLAISVQGIPAGEVSLAGNLYRTAVPLDPSLWTSAHSPRSKVLDPWLEIGLKLIEQKGISAGEFAYGISALALGPPGRRPA